VASTWDWLQLCVWLAHARQYCLLGLPVWHSYVCSDTQLQHARGSCKFPYQSLLQASFAHSCTCAETGLFGVADLGSGAVCLESCIYCNNLRTTAATWLALWVRHVAGSVVSPLPIAWLCDRKVQYNTFASSDV
jgi:hypothetical protein